MQVQGHDLFGQTSRWVLMAAFVLVFLFALWIVRDIVLLTLLAVILVVGLTIPIRLLVRRGMPRVAAIILSLVGIIAIIVSLTILALPSLVVQFTALATETVPAGINRLVDDWNSGRLKQEYPVLENVEPLLQNIDQQQINDFIRQAGDFVGDLGGRGLALVGNVIAILLNTLVLIFLTLYFLAEPDTYQEGLIKLFPIWYRQRVRAILIRLELMLRKWLQATLLSMIFVGVLTWIGLQVLGLQQAVALGVLTGLFSFIPNFGPILALIPSLAVGIVQAPQNLGWVVVIIYGTSFLQSQIISPILLAESLNMPPVLVLIGQIVAYLFFGFMGALLAVPIIAILIVVVQEVYIRDILGDFPASEQPPRNETYSPTGV
jgi:predicted PurR-regulated permease PerM